MHFCGDKARYVSHVHQVIGSDSLGDLLHCFEVDDSRIRRATRDNYRWLVLDRNTLNLVVVEHFSLPIDVVVSDLKNPSGLIRRCSVTEVAAGREVHAQNAGARLGKREQSGLIGLSS